MALSTISAQVTAAGISAPSFADIRAYLQDKIRAIYGSDVYIAPDSQDGQLLSLVAAAINDCNQAAVAVYNAFSPTYAQGIGLSSAVKINNIRRLPSSFSTAVGTIAGVAGTDVSNAVVQDDNGNRWNLPAVITIPQEGSVSVTVTAQQAGAIAAPAGSITKIATPLLGWQSFASTSDAVPGQPIESDAALRRRQSASQPLSAITPLAALYGAVANLNGVKRLQVYENTAAGADANGLPGHSICLVVEGGTLIDIAQVIGLKKTPGANTYGTTSQQYIDPVTGIISTIHFFLLTFSAIKVALTIKPLTGYSSAVIDKIKAAIAAYINGLDIGQLVQFSRMYSPAYLNGAALGQTYEVTALQIAIVGNAFGTADLAIAFNKAASCDVANIAITVSP